MKKLITTVALAFTVMTASAQWQQETKPADELMGTPSSVEYLYTDASQGCLKLSSTHPEQYMLGTVNGIFHTVRTGRMDVAQVRIGFYDSTDSLVQKADATLEASAGNRRIIWLPDTAGKKDKEIARQIVNHLSEHGNYVRFVAYLYGGGAMDLIVPSLPK